MPNNENLVRNKPTDLKQENDFIIDTYKLVAYNKAEYDIQHLVAETVIYEDIFNNFISGSITLAESIDLPQLYPLIGEEKIILKFSRPKAISVAEYESTDSEPLDYYNLEARIIEVTKRKRAGENKQAYILNFVSEEYIKSLKKKITKSYIGKRYSEMVASIFKDEAKLTGRKDIVIEPTMFLHDYVFSSYSTMEAIGILSAISISDEGNGSYFVFYEDRDQFNFTTVGKLMKQPVAIELGHSVANVFKKEGLTDHPRDIERDMIAAKYFTFHGGPSITNNLLGGMYSSQLLTVDPMRKIYEEYDFDYKKEWAKMPHIDANDICTDDLDALGAPETVQMLEFTNKDHDKVAWIASKQPGIKPWNVEKWLQTRLSQYQQMENHKMGIEIPGDPRRKAGEVIFFDMPSSTGDIREDNKLEPDKYLSGKYLVTVCKHILKAREYTCQMELIKDSFVSKIEHVDITKKYENII